MNQSFAGTAESKLLNVRLSRVSRFENHDQALLVWRNSGCADRILVHVDAHHDMWWVHPGQAVTIANFVSAALQDNLLREIFWVVPDRSWESAKKRRQILHHLRRIQEDFPGRRAAIEIQQYEFRTQSLLPTVASIGPRLVT